MPDGLTIVPDFVTRDEESSFLLEIGAIPGDRGRRFKRYGVPVYGDHHTDQPVPRWLAELGARLPMPFPDEFTLNEWQPGSILGHHADLGGPVICVVSLLGDGVIQFAAHRRPHETVRCPRRGLLVMTGLARTVYTHAVMPSDEPRISLVFRTVS